MTKSEIEDKDFTWLKNLNLENTKTKIDEESYKNLISLMVGSHYITFASPTYCPSKIISKVKEKIIMGAKLTDSEKTFDKIRFCDIKGKSLGRIENILF